MAELVDAPGSGPGGRKTVEVRVLFSAPVLLAAFVRKRNAPPAVRKHRSWRTGRQTWRSPLTPQTDAGARWCRRAPHRLRSGRSVLRTPPLYDANSGARPP